MGADFQNAFYQVFAVPIALLLAFTLAGAVSLSLLRLITGAFGFRRPGRPKKYL